MSRVSFERLLDHMTVSVELAMEESLEPDGSGCPVESTFRKR